MPVKPRKIHRLMRLVVALFVAFLAMPLSAASHRISYSRTIPPPHFVAAEGEVPVLYAHGDPDRIDLFLQRLIAEVNRGPGLQLLDVAERTSDGQQARGTPSRARQHAGAAAYLGVSNLTCTATDRQGEASYRDADGQRVWRRAYWLEAKCVAELDILSTAVKRVGAFTITAEGLSPKRPAIDAQLRTDALDSATRYAARKTAEAILPRRVHESIVLDETSPAFHEAMTFIDTSQPARARAVWEKAVPANPRSAALRYNLGAVCEAVGDLKAADEHYRAAVLLRPDETRYSVELKAFRRRQAAGRP